MDKESKKDRVKRHFIENKKVYLVGASCLATGYLLRRPEVVQTFNNSTDNIATIVNRSKNVDVVIKYLNARNYNANPIRCIETGVEWASQTEAAEAMNILSPILSRHLNGKLPNAKGYHFERIA